MFSNWQDVDIEEIYCFLAINILFGLVEKQRIKDYWSTNPIIATPFFGKIFARDRFEQILRGLHFVDNSALDKSDSLRKIRPILESLVKKFASVMNPFRDLCIDESLMLYKGRLGFRQYIPSKRSRFGIKLFLLCDVDTSYVLKIIVYTGSSTNITEDRSLGVSGAVVTTLMKDYLHKGHVLYIDNWYTSPHLVEFLHENQTGTCGTVRGNRKGLPTFQKKLNKNEIDVFHTNVQLAIKWHDKRDVHILTTVATAEMKDIDKKDVVTKEIIKKPDCIIDYNNKMGAVDKVDMQTSFVEISRKSIKWYKKLFFHLMDISLYNAFVAYQVNTGNKPSIYDFRLKVVGGLIENYKRPSAPKRIKVTGETPLRLTERHFPIVIPQTATKGRSQRRCYVCSHTSLIARKRKDTTFMCEECDKALCVYPCFKNYHTLKKF